MRLTYSKFEAWLKSKPANQIVGRKRDNCGCPLACFHAEASGGWEVVISSYRDGFGYVIDRGYGDRRLPAWADAFAFLVDRGDADKITASHALAVLAQVNP